MGRGKSCLIDGKRNMNCYLINLDRSSDRLAFISHQVEWLQRVCKDITLIRVPAVDARQLSQETIDSYYDRDYFSFNATYFPNIVQPGGLSNGEVACFLSHRKCWQKIIDDNQPYAAIFEDDVYFSKDSALYLANGDWLPADADIVKFELMTRKLIVDKNPTNQFNGRVITRFYNTNVGAAAYVVTRKAAEKLLKMTERFYLPVDHVMFGDLFPYFSQLVCYQVVPALCIQDKELNGDAGIFDTTLAARDDQIVEQKKKKLSLGIKIKREFIRFKVQMKAKSGAKKKIINTFNADEIIAEDTDL